jgi:O-antigen/teichoic acid export membrane protein
MKWRDTTHVPIDWTWIRRGVFASLPFIGSSVALKAIETVDRYILKQHWNEGLVGVYTFYASIANAMQALLYSGIIMVLYPSVVRAFQAGEMGEYRRLMRKLAGGTLVGSLAFIAVGSVAILPVLHMIGKPLYWEHLDAYWILLVSAGAVCIGSVPHFGLYARRQDRTLMLCALASFGLGLALNFLLVPQWGIKGAAVSTCSAFISLALFKTLALFGQWKARSA